MNEKVKLPRKVAMYIDQLRESGEPNWAIMKRAYIYGDCYPNTIFDFAEQPGNFDRLINALATGYEVEQTPEETLRKYYDKLQKKIGDPNTKVVRDEVAESLGITMTLEILGIKIEGVND